MNKSQGEPRREDMYLVDYLQQIRGSTSLNDFRLCVVLISLGMFLIILLLFFILRNHVVIFNRCVWALIITYFITFTITVYNGIKRYQHRSDELSRYIIKAFNDLRFSSVYYGPINSKILRCFMLVFSIFFQYFIFIRIYNNLGVTVESLNNIIPKDVPTLFAFVLLFNLSELYGLYGWIIISVCIFIKVKKILSRLF